MDISREKEWTKWKQYNVATVITAEEALEPISEGAEEIGTQWIETDKNEHLRTSAKEVEMLLKSR